MILIVGNGHSGSTLLDIVLGAQEKAFSAGELTFIARDTILDEYCSCGAVIGQCEVWSEIMTRWEKERGITLDDFRKYRRRFERNKVAWRALWSSLFPSEGYLHYQKSTLKLFDIIHEVTQAGIIVDSSKSPTRVPLLRNHIPIKIVHLCRSFTGVLNSAMKSSKKDIKAGIEADNPSRRTSKTLFDWLLTNFLAAFFCLGLGSYKLKYKAFIKTPSVLGNIDPVFSDSEDQAPYSPTHMLAGNVLRLKKNILINKDIGFRFSRLSKGQVRLGRVIDRLFFFWS